MKIMYQNIPSGELAVIRLEEPIRDVFPEESVITPGTPETSIFADLRQFPAGELVCKKHRILVPDAAPGRFEPILDWRDIGYASLVDLSVAREFHLHSSRFLDLRDAFIIRVVPGRWRWTDDGTGLRGYWIGDAFPMDDWHDEPSSGLSVKTLESVLSQKPSFAGFVASSAKQLRELTR